PGVGRLGMTGLQLLEAVDADALCEASPVHIEAGAEPGLSHIRTALERGMHVVTPNKGPIVLAHRELVALAREHGVMLRFDGTVAGGLPALALGARDLRGAVIHRIEAVPNLTTGFVLDLLAGGATMEAAIEQAAETGALEADPNWDLDGWDAAAKLVILAKAVLGVDASLEDVHLEGIRNVDVDSIRHAGAEGRLVRLVAIAERLEDGTYDFRVAPTELPAGHPLGHLGENEMGIVYETDIYGTITAIIDEPTPLPSAATMLRDLLDIYG
ncbi:MAG: homoserine dehydrogenase, partial [Candidatus Bipolaricaulia bacterium]